MKVGGFAALNGFSYTTRANISHEIAEQIRARIVCTPAESALAGVGRVCALTGWSYIFHFGYWLCLDYIL